MVYYIKLKCSLVSSKHLPLLVTPPYHIIIAGDLPGIVAVHFNNLWEIVIYGIEFQLMITAPGDSFLQGFSGAAGPEDELVAGSFLINKVFDQRSVWLAELRPLAKAEGSVKLLHDSAFKPLTACRHR